MKRCLHCGKRRKLPKGRYVAVSEYEADPFCSRSCCEAHYGLEPPAKGGYGIDYGASERRKEGASR